jgi:hypothetical protein
VTGKSADESPPTTTGCPVDLVQQIWIETSMHWFIEQFGKDAVSSEVALPTPELLPTPYTGTVEQVATLLGRAATAMGVEASELDLEFFGHGRQAAVRHSDTTRAVGHYRVRNGRPVIALDTGEISDPKVLTAVIAHELGHVRLLGEGRITHARGDHERLTDLLTVFLGFGVFTTNASLNYARATRGWTVQPRGDLDERRLNAARNDGYTRLGYLSEAEFGYGLACYAWLRRERDPTWATYLDPGPRTHLHQGLTYLNLVAEGDEFPTRTAGTGRISIRVVATGKSPLTGLYFHSPRFPGT